MGRNNVIQFNKFDYQKNLSQQRELFRECFPENNGTTVETIEHYYWKFHSFPGKKKSYEYIAESESSILGYYAALPYEYLIGNDKVRVGMVCDVMTGIKARGKGIFTQLGKFATDELKKEELVFTTGYPIRPEVIPGHLKVGWEIIFDLPLFIGVIKIDSILKSKKLGYLTPIIRVIFSRLKKIMGYLSEIDSKFYIDVFTNKQIDKIDKLEEFIARWSHGKKIVLNKTSDFLKWRLNAPGKEYDIIVLSENEKIVGVAIARFVIKEKIPSFALLDIMILEDNKLYSKNMFRAIYKIAEKKNAECLLIMSSNPTAKKLNFFRNGLLKSPYKFKLIIKRLNSQYTDDLILNQDNWNLMWIDSDDL
ncbi:MAG: GNAT family N-acetyltransferase [Ignavibacteriaceae bacterium]|nr:GNAT family N-acetyltransferase [Ignavibacteriaceae bacterium]